MMREASKSKSGIIDFIIDIFTNILGLYHSSGNILKNIFKVFFLLKFYITHLFYKIDFLFLIHIVMLFKVG